MFKFLLLSLFTICSLNLHASSSLITAKSIAIKPNIDGKINDKCWDEATWQTNFLSLGTKQKAFPQTWFKIVHNNNFIYIAVKLEEPKMNQLKGKIVEHDGPVYRDDCVEIFIDANNDKTTYKHFIINSLGTVYDAERRQGGHVSTIHWNSAGIKTAVSKQKTSWTMEVAIPLIELGVTSDTIRINITRERHNNKTTQLSTFANLSGSFHEPINFINLKLQKLAVANFAWTIKAPYGLTTIIQDKQKYLQGKLFIFNKTGKFRFVKLRSSLSPKNSQVQTFAIDNELGKEYSIKVPVNENGSANLSIELIDRSTNKPMVLVQFPVTIHYSPLSITLSQPCYRNTIFSDQQLTTLKGNIVSSLPAMQLKQSTLTLTLSNKQGKILVKKNLPKVTANMNFSLPLPKLNYAEYMLKGTITGSNKYQTQLIIKKLTPLRGQVRIDANLTTYIDGKKFFPYGWFAVSEKHWSRIKKVGANLLIDYNAYYKTDTELKQWLDKVQAAGLKAIIYPYPNRSFNDTRSWHKPLSAAEAQAIRKFIHKWKNHSALLGWYMVDEPELRPALPARIKAIYDICRNEDPYHPAIILNDTISGIHKYINYADILNPDPYPLFLKNGDAASPIEKVSKFISAILKTKGQKKVAWITPQAFNYGDYGAANNRAPNFLELRNMQYQAIIAGAQGFTWYAWYSSLDYPQITISMEYLTKEATLLKDIIMSPQKRIALKTNDKLAEAVLYPQVNKYDYIFAVNNAKTAKKIVIQLPKDYSEKLYIVGENRVIKADNGEIRELFGKYDVNIYTTNANLANSISLQQTVKKITSSIKKLKRPGNLAVIKGVTVSFSSKKSYWDSSHIVDGSREGQGWIDSTYRQFPDWATLKFNKTVVIKRAELFCEKITDAELQIKEQKKWETIANFKRISPSQMRANFAPIKTSAIRLLIKNSSNGKTMIRELEIY